MSLLIPLIGAALAGSLNMGPGTTLVVTDVASGDPNAAARASLIGEVCQAGAAGLSSTGDGWWAGTLDCANGQSYTARSVAVAVPGSAPSPRSVSPSTIAAAIGSTINFPTGAAVGSYGGLIGGVVGGPVGTAEAPASSLRTQVGAGEPVILVGLSPEDAYYGSTDIIGKACYPTDTMSYNDNGWHGGPVQCLDGQSYYFYKVGMAPDPSRTRVEVGGGSSSMGVLGALGGDEATGFGGLGAISNGGEIIPDGKRVKILDVSSQDAFYPDRGELVGKKCRVTGDLHLNDPAGWYGGGLTCKSQYYYFYMVKVQQ